MAEKITYEAKAGVTSASIDLADGKQLRFGDGHRDKYETSDPAEQAQLDAFPGVKRAEAKKKDGAG